MKLEPSVGKSSSRRFQKYPQLLDFTRMQNECSDFLKNDSVPRVALQKPAILLDSEIWLGRRNFQLESVRFG